MNMNLIIKAVFQGSILLEFNSIFKYELFQNLLNNHYFKKKWPNKYINTIAESEAPNNTIYETQVLSITIADKIANNEKQGKQVIVIINRVLNTITNKNI